MKFRKKPIEIEATMYRPGLEDCWLVVTSGNDIEKIFSKQHFAEAWLMENSHMAESVRPGIRTLEGPHIINEGDWIITGVMGERYPCNPKIFAMTYDPIE